MTILLQIALQISLNYVLVFMTSIFDQLDTLDIPFCRLSTGQRSLAYRGAKLWNSLSSNLKCLKCPKKFKHQFTKLLLG